MRHYLRHLFELYVAYMKLALIGMTASALLFGTYSALKTDHILIGLPLTLLIAAIIYVLVLWWRYNSLQIELRKTDLVRREQETLKSPEAPKARPAQVSEELFHIYKDYYTGDLSRDPSLAKEVALFILELQNLNLDDSSIQDALADFLTTQERLRNRARLPSVRKRILNSIKRKIIKDTQRDREGEKVAR